jgi:aminoglycoside phosphotransferase (APT) family kinase protein
MMGTAPPGVLAWVEASLGPGARVLAVREMAPSSTTKHEIRASVGGGSDLHLVVRRYTNAERLATDRSYDPANEVRALLLLDATDVPAPHLFASDLVPSRCDVPTLLESFVAGEAGPELGDLDRYLASAAEVLVAVHDASATRPKGLPDYVPYLVSDGIEPRPPAWSSRARMWQRVIEVLASEPPEGRDRFIHRDYHPGNVLSLNGRVTAVVDWPTAAWGPPGIDLARMRLNLASDLGLEAAESFSEAYRSAGGAPEDRDPYWDLRDAADLLIEDGPKDAEEAAEWDRFESWVERVLSEL